LYNFGRESKNVFMKRISFFIFLIVLSIITSLTAAGQKSGFSGTWKLDRVKSVLTEYSPALTKITVNIKGDSLLTERFYEAGDGQVYPFNENLSLDGTECKITIYDMPRKTKALWSEQENSVNLESTTTFYGSNGLEDFVSKETWKIDKDNNSLTIAFINKFTAGESVGHFLFNKEAQ